MAQVLFGGIQQTADLVFLIADSLLGDQNLLDARGYGRFCLQHVDDGHHPGLCLGAVRGQELFRRFQGCLRNLEIFIGEYHLPESLFHGGDHGHDAIQEDMLLDRGIVLRDVDEGFVHVDAEVLEERLGHGQSQATRVCRVEQKRIGPADERALWAIVQIEIGAGVEVLRDIRCHPDDILVEFGNLLQIGAREPSTGRLRGATCRLYCPLRLRVGSNLACSMTISAMRLSLV